MRSAAFALAAVIRHPARSFLRAGLLAVFLALPLAAQEHPNTDRGFTAERSFLAGDVDNVNLFNGNLVLTIPLGIFSEEMKKNIIEGRIRNLERQINNYRKMISDLRRK